MYILLTYVYGKSQKKSKALPDEWEVESWASH